MKQRAKRTTRGLMVALMSGVILMLLPSLSFAAELRLTDDARTDSTLPNQNFGMNNQNLRVSATANSYLKFDLSVLPAGTVGSDVTKATLKLWTDTATTLGSFDLRRVTGAWTEETITWTSAQSLVLGATDGTGAVTKSLSFTTVELTQLVKDWLGGVQANDGLALVAIGSTNVPFDSKEDPSRSHEPRLEVSLAGDITAVIAGTGLTGGGAKGDVTLSVDTNFIQNRVAGSCATGSSIRVINANGTVECEVDDNSGGTVTSVATGSGLTGGPITTTGTISVATGGITSAMIAANSVDSSKIVDGSVGSADVNSAQVQLRVGGTCSAGNAIQTVNADGTVTCASTGTIGGNGTTNYVPKFTASTTLGNSVIFETSGNVGIGSSLPTNPLEVRAGGSAMPAALGITTTGSLTAGNGVIFQFNGNNGHTTMSQIQSAIEATGQESSYMAFETNNAGAGGERMRITSSGNVGIGTTSPQAKLEIQGHLANNYLYEYITNDGTAGSDATFLRVKNAAGGFLYVGVEANDGANIAGGTIGSAGIITSGGGKSLQLGADQAVGMTFLAANNNVGIGTTNPTSLLHVNGTLTAVTKNFQIDHPLEPDKKFLVHSALEGPEVGVYYRGEAQLVNGETEITLPSYFEALTRKEQRTVQLTPIKGWAPLFVMDEIQEGRFSVKTANGGNPNQRFYWEVKAVRADVEPLVVEKLKPTENMNVVSRNAQ